jgi:argininosuccinate synthase
MEWAAAHGVPVPTTHKKPYSIDDNLWGRAIECGVLEDTWNQPPADIWTMTKNPEDCPADPETVVIGFEGACPSRSTARRCLCSTASSRQTRLPAATALAAST